MKTCDHCGSKIQKFAVKGDVEGESAASDDPSVAETEDTSLDDPSGGTAAEEPETPIDQDSPAQTTDESQPEQSPTQATAQASAANTIDVVGQQPGLKAPMPPPTPTAQELADEQASIDQDKKSMQINPKTYNDLLWKDKSVPGKIGSLFGLLLSGMGSGLTHQPNMLLEMMNKTIDNDLNAQRATAEGGRNLYQLHLQHQMNRFQQQRDYYQSYADYLKSKMNPKEAEKLQSDINNANEMAKRNHEEAALLHTKNGMLDGTLDIFNNNAANMPPGPLQNNAVQTINAVSPLIQAQKAQNINDAAGRMGLNSAMAPYPMMQGQGPLTGEQDQAEPDTNAPVANPAVLKDLMRKSAIVGVPAAAQLDKAMQENSHAEEVRGTARRYYDAFDALNTPGAGQSGEIVSRALSTLGSLADPIIRAASMGTPVSAIIGANLGSATNEATRNAAETVIKFQQWRNAQVASLLPIVSRQTAGQYNTAEAHDIADGLFPSIYDLGNEDIRKAKFYNGMKMFENEERTPTLDILGGRASAFPKFKYPDIHPDKDKKSEQPPKKLDMSNDENFRD